MTKKKRQDSGKSQISLVASRLAEILPTYGAPPLKHAQAIEIAALASGFRSSNAAIAAARDIGPMPDLAHLETVDTASGPMHVLMDPASGRPFGVDDAFRAAPPAGCVATPYGALAATSGLGRAPPATAPKGARVETHVAYFDHKHGHEHFTALSEDELYLKLEDWCRDQDGRLFEELAAEHEDAREAVSEFLSNRTEGWHTDAIPGFAPTARQKVAIVTYKGEDTVLKAASEEGLTLAVTQCLYDHQLLYEERSKAGIDPSLPSRQALYELINLSDVNWVEWGADEEPEAPPAAMAAPQRRVPVYSATVTHRHGEQGFIASSEEELDAKIAAYCIESENDLPSGKRFHGDPENMSDADVIGHYFAHIGDEWLERHGATGQVEAPDEGDSAKALRALLAVFELKLGKLSYDEKLDAADFDECEGAIAEARRVLGYHPAPPPKQRQAASGPEAAGGAGKALQIAIATFDGGNVGFADPDYGKLQKKVSVWCLDHWSEAAARDVSREEALGMEPEDVIEAYFDGHDEDGIEFSEDSDILFGGRPVPRALVTVRNGMAEVEAADGAIDVAIVDFDVSETLSESEIESKTRFVRYSGDAATLEGLVEGHAIFLREHFGDEEVAED